MTFPSKIINIVLNDTDTDKKSEKIKLIRVRLISNQF